jgi:hypothetical protein
LGTATVRAGWWRQEDADMTDQDSTDRPTETQPAPNISTEHQVPGDARRPDDALDRDERDEDAAPSAGPAERGE